MKYEAIKFVLLLAAGVAMATILCLTPWGRPHVSPRVRSWWDHP